MTGSSSLSVSQSAQFWSASCCSTSLSFSRLTKAALGMAGPICVGNPGRMRHPPGFQDQPDPHQRLSPLFSMTVREVTKATLFSSQGKPCCQALLPSCQGYCHKLEDPLASSSPIVTPAFIYS